MCIFKKGRFNFNFVCTFTILYKVLLDTVSVREKSPVRGVGVAPEHEIES